MKIYYFFIAAFLLSIISCASKPSVVVNESFNGKEINVKAGEIFEVRLEAQLGTGYSWKCKNIPDILSVNGREKSEPKDKNVAGGYDYQIFQYKAEKKGAAELVFIYDKSWEKNIKDNKTITYKIIIQ